MPGTLFAAIAMPMPVPHSSRPRSAWPRAMACATAMPMSGYSTGWWSWVPKAVTWWPWASKAAFRQAFMAVAGRDGLRHGDADVGVEHGLVVMGAEVRHLVALGQQGGLQAVFHGVGGLVAADGDFHGGFHCTVWRPSISRLAPVTMPAWPLTRYKMAAAISSGCAKRPTGIFFFIASPTAPDQACLPSAVSTTVGETALTVMP